MYVLQNAYVYICDYDECFSYAFSGHCFTSKHMHSLVAWFSLLRL